MESAAAVEITTAMATDSGQIQKILDEAFAKFKTEFPEVARTIEMMNVSYAEYLLMLSNLNNEIPTTAGNAFTPF